MAGAGELISGTEITQTQNKGPYMQNLRFYRFRFFMINLACLLLFITAVFGQEKKQSYDWAGKKNTKLERSGSAVSQDELTRIANKMKGILQQRTGQAATPKGVGTIGQLAESYTAIDKGLDRQVERHRRTADWEVLWNERDDVPAFVRSKDRSKPVYRLAAAKSSAEVVTNFLLVNKEVFRLENPESELTLTADKIDDLGKKHLRFQQYYQGIPVWAQEMTVHMDGETSIYSMNARYVATPTAVDVSRAGIASATAVQIAESDLAVDVEIVDFDSETRELLQYPAPIATRYIWVDRETGTPHLVWHVQIRPNLRDNWYYFVDVNSGAVLQKYNATMFDGPVTGSGTDLNGQTRTLNLYEQGGTYYMIDASRSIWQATQPNLLNDPKGALWTIDARGNDLTSQTSLYHVTSTNNSWADQSSVSAHYNIGEVFEYFEDTHGRSAIDGNGSTVISVIHVTSEGQPMDNAFWNGVLMAYGDGNNAFTPLAGALDVAAHEMSHGVIQNTVNLEYQFESGALNESFADVFGAMVDNDDWRLGEEVVNPAVFTSGALRDMQDPHNGGSSINDPGWQPSHMDEFLDWPLSQDNGGVHVNSGIPNRVCFLVGDAIGRAKTEQIYYRILNAMYLNQQSNFVDMRLAAIQSATDLYGDPSTELTAVVDAFDAVGIVGDTGTLPPDDDPPVEGEEWIAMVNGDGYDQSLYVVRPVIDDSYTDIVLLTTTQVYDLTANPISVSDDGSVIMFVDESNFIRTISPDGSNEVVISTDGVWSSIALSPDGNKLAATTTLADTTIYIFDFVDATNTKAVRLYTPTTGSGTNSDVTLFADAIDWDFTGSYVVYDAFNRIPQASGINIEYWDMNILEVATEVIIPIFAPQAEGISIGNPSLAQNNDRYLVFDFLDSKTGSSSVLAVDLFEGTTGVIEDNFGSVGFPKYSVDDNTIAFERDDYGTPTVRQIAVASDKINASGVSQPYVTAGQRPSWFAIGQRPVGIEEDGISPKSFTLAQNFPNPFNPETTIRYELNRSAEVELAIYDISGRQVTTLVSGRQVAGQYQVTWNGLDRRGNPVASGIYLYRLESRHQNGSVERFTRKMTFLK